MDTTSSSSLSLADFRSDTVTRPLPGMRAVIQKAVIMDDYGKQDPGILNLEKRVASLFGKEAALFIPTATMGNLICVMCHCERGASAIMGARCHINLYEGGGISQLGGVYPKTVPN